MSGAVYLLPAAALLLGSGILTYIILVRQRKPPRETPPGLHVIPGVVPKAGTVLTPERMAKNLKSLNSAWTRTSEGGSMDYELLAANVPETTLAEVMLGIVEGEDN